MVKNSLIKSKDSNWLFFYNKKIIITNNINIIVNIIVSETFD